MMVNDELLEKLGNYYCSNYVRLCRPDILQMTFDQFFNRELMRINNTLKINSTEDMNNTSWR